MIFDLARYKDEQITCDDNKQKIDEEKLFLLGVRIKADMVELLLNGIKAKNIKVKKLDASENSNYGVINVVAASALADWGFELKDPSEIGKETMSPEDEIAEAKGQLTGSKFNKVDYGETKILKKTVSAFGMGTSKNKEELYIASLQDDIDAFRDQLNNELNAFPAPTREMVMMTILDRFHSWEKNNWENDRWS
ncbi:MAG: hypothetical protein IJL19_09905 [Clostridiales bacterium]|nr:hypothetical protein [Clostridiales bacterium]